MADGLQSSPNELQPGGEHFAAMDTDGTMAALLAERDLLDSLIATLEDMPGETALVEAAPFVSRTRRRCQDRSSHEMNGHVTCGPEARHGR